MQSYNNREIAAKLFVCERTVKNHLYSVFKRIGVSDRRELVRHCLEAEDSILAKARSRKTKKLWSTVSILVLKRILRYCGSPFKMPCFCERSLARC